MTCVRSRTVLLSAGQVHLGDGFVVKRAERQIGRLRFPHDEAALLVDLTAENSHADMLADPVGPEIGEMRGFLAGMDTKFEREPDREWWS